MKKAPLFALLLTCVFLLAACAAGPAKSPKTLSGTKWTIESITEDGVTQPISDFDFTGTITFSDASVTIFTDSDVDEYDQENTYPYTYADGVATVAMSTDETFAWKDGKLEWQDAEDTLITLVPAK